MDRTATRQQQEFATIPRRRAVGEPQTSEPCRSAQPDWPALAGSVVAAAIFAALSWPLIKAWSRAYVDPDGYYAHGPLIPFIVGLMFWHLRKPLQSIEKKPFPWALLVLVPALPLLIFTTRVFPSSLATVAFFLVIWSSVWAVLGTRFLVKAAFPLAFLATMAPLPKMVLTDSTYGLQTFSTLMAVKFLHLLHMSATITGNVIQLENYTLIVDVPCSGFKLLLSFLTVSAALAYLLDGPAVKRFLLFVATMPLSLAVNAVRIGLVGVVGDCIGPDAAHQFHDWSGMLTLVGGVAAMLFIARGLGCRTFAGWPLF